MKILIILLTILSLGCSAPGVTTTSINPIAPAAYTIKKDQEGRFHIVADRPEMEKITKGLACLKMPVKTIRTTQGISNTELIAWVSGAAIVFFTGGFLVGRQ